MGLRREMGLTLGLIACSMGCPGDDEETPERNECSADFTDAGPEHSLGDLGAAPCNLVFLEANVFTGACEDMSANLAIGVSDGTMTYPGLAGVTRVTWSIAIPSATFSNNNTCATALQGALVELHAVPTSYVIQWVPGSGSSECEQDEAAYWNLSVQAHECFHSAQVRAYDASQMSMVTLGAAVTACSDTKAKAEVALVTAVHAAIRTQHIAPRESAIQAIFDEFDQSSAGAAVYADCSRCPPPEKSYPRCCEFCGGENGFGNTSNKLCYVEPDDVDPLNTSQGTSQCTPCGWIRDFDTCFACPDGKFYAITTDILQPAQGDLVVCWAAICGPGHASPGIYGTNCPGNVLCALNEPCQRVDGGRTGYGWLSE